LTAGAIDSRLEDTANRLSQMQADARQLKIRISNYILVTAIWRRLGFRLDRGWSSRVMPVWLETLFPKPILGIAGRAELPS
jgi:hypothetical protein